MTIDSSYKSETFNKTSSGVYTFSFEHLGADTIRVAEVDEDGGVTDLPSTDYTVITTGNGPIYVGGQVSVGASPSNIEKIVVTRATPQTQLVDYQPYSPFPAETHEYALDKLTMLGQEANFNANLAVAYANDVARRVNEQIIAINEAIGGIEGDIEGIEGDIALIPRANMFIPLSGTAKNAPITGKLEWAAGARNIGSYFMQTTSAYIGNWWGMFTETNNSGIILQTRGSGGTAHNFEFRPGGALVLPHVYGGSRWHMAVGPNEGEDESLTIWPTNTADQNVDGNFVVWTSLNTRFVFQPDGALRLAKAIEAGDPPWTAATKEYVDSLLGPSSGESNTQTNMGGGVELGMAKVGVDLPLRTLTVNAGELQLTQNAQTVHIEFDPAGLSLPAIVSPDASFDELEVTGQIIMHGDVDADNVVATKGYVDGVLSGGGLMVDLVSNQEISGVKTFNDDANFAGLNAASVVAAGVQADNLSSTYFYADSAGVVISGDGALTATSGSGIVQGYLTIAESRGYTMNQDPQEIRTDAPTLMLRATGSITFNDGLMCHAGNLDSTLRVNGGLFGVNPGAVVRTSTNQTIAGVKTFTNQTRITGNTTIGNNPDNIDGGAFLHLERGNGEKLGIDSNEIATNSSSFAISSKGELFQFNGQEICHEGRLDATLHYVGGKFGVANPMAASTMQEFMTRLVDILDPEPDKREQIRCLMEAYR